MMAQRNQGTEIGQQNNGNGNGNGGATRWALGVIGLLSAAAIIGMVNMYRTQGIQDRDLEILRQQIIDEKIERRASDADAQKRLDVHREQWNLHEERIRHLEEEYRNHSNQDTRRFDDMNRDKRYRAPYDR